MPLIYTMCYNYPKKILTIARSLATVRAEACLFTMGEAAEGTVNALDGRFNAEINMASRNIRIKSFQNELTHGEVISR